MQKKIIALAVAGLASTAAFAQSNVTIYGVMDVGQAFVNSSTDVAGVKQKSVGRLDNNSSYIGFKGVEDLGNGLKAVFQYESGFTGDDSGALAGGRDTYVGLAGGFGTVAAGTLTHPLRAFGTKAEIMPGSAGFGTLNSITGTIGGVKTGADERAKNAIAYISPSFSGFTVIGAYVNGETKTDTATARAWQLAGQYENGPLFVGLGYHHAKNPTFKAATADSVSVDAAGVVTGVNGADSIASEKARVVRAVVTYTLPSATKLSALYDNTKATDTTGVFAGAVELKRQAWAIGVAQPFGKNTVGLQYAQNGKLKVNGESADETQSRIISALYSYELSKRTMLHARYSHLSNKDGANVNFYNNPVANGVTPGVGANYSGFMVGVRHSF